jgi:hypothetical protein
LWKGSLVKWEMAEKKERRGMERMSRWQVRRSLNVSVQSREMLGRGDEEGDVFGRDGVNFSGRSAIDVQFWVSMNEATSVGKFLG